MEPAHSMATARIAPTYVNLLRNRNFRLLTAAFGVSTLGDAFFELALIWIIYSNTGSTLQASGVVVTERIASVAVSLVAGTLVDRWNRRRTMIAADVARFFVVSAIAFLAWQSSLTPMLAFLCVFLRQAASVFFNHASSAMMPAVVLKDELVTASGIAQTTYQGVYLLGKAVGGFAVAALGVVFAFLADAVSFLVSAGALSLMKVSLPRAERRDEPRTNPWLRFYRDLFGGWSVITQQKTVLWLMIIVLLINAVAIGALFPSLVTKQLRGDVRVFGFLEAAFVIGSMAGAAVSGWINRRIGTGRLFASSLTVVSLATVGIGLSTWVPLTIVLALLMTLSTSVASIPVGALIQTLIPSEYLGRAFGFLGAAASIMGPLGALASGWLGDAVGPGAAVVIAGVWGLIPAAMAWLNPHIRVARAGGREV